MKKIIIALCIFFGGYYTYTYGMDNQNKFELIKYNGICSYAPGDTTKQAADSTGQTGGEASGNTQHLMDSLNAVQNGGTYGNYNSNSSDEHVPGTREPNTYKSGRTGGQYDAVIRPGIDPIKKKDDQQR